MNDVHKAGAILKNLNNTSDARKHISDGEKADKDTLFLEELAKFRHWLIYSLDFVSL